MIVRIVKMTFRPDCADHFLSIFEASKQKIRHFPGCQQLELWRATDDPNVFTTYSHWDEPASLEKYRQSDLFKTTWSKTRVLFAQKPEAWSSTVFLEAK